MPEIPDPTDWVRVLDVDTGHQRSIRRSALPHGNYTVLNEPAVDPTTGERLPTVHRAAPAAAAPVDYSSWTVAQLREEVERRNDARGDEQVYVMVAEPGNKPELVAGLAADDATQTLSSNPTGQQADTPKENA